MRILHIFIGLIAGIAVFSVHCLAADLWPGGAGTTIATLTEPSGILWHPGRETLFVVEDSGTEILHEISSSGTVINSWPVAGDLEGITLAEGTRYLYIGIEHPDHIVEFDLQTEALTGKSWDLTPWMTGPDNSGLEGLAYSDGKFYAGLQSDGQIYVFDVDLAVSGNVDHIETFRPDESYTTDISGIDINADTGRKYVIYDTANALVELDSQNTGVADYSLPGDNQEGIAVVPDCATNLADIYIAEDSGLIKKYSGYPISCDLVSPSAPSGLSVE